MRQLNVSSVEEREYSFRISDDASSTQAELSAILLGLRRIGDTGGKIFFFVGSRNATEPLTSIHSLCEDIVERCKESIRELGRQNRKVTFIWIGYRHT